MDIIGRQRKTQTIFAFLFHCRRKGSTKKYYTSGYATDNKGFFDGLEMINNEVNQRADLNCMEGAVDSRLIFHVANAGSKRVQKLPGII